MTEIIDFLKKYTDGKQNTEKAEISVLQLNRVIKALEQEPFMNKPCVAHNELANAIEYLNLERRLNSIKFGETRYTRILDVVIEALMYGRNQYIIGYGNCLKDHMTGKWNPEDGVTRPHTDNRGAEPKDVTDKNYNKDYDTISCPHCGCTLSNFVVMPDHYCYVCGGQFGRELITEGKEE